MNGDTRLAEELYDKADRLLQRSTRAYTSLFDRNRGLMVPRGGNNYGFNPIEWGKGYTEGNAWHHSFPAYAITPPLTAGRSSLADLYGGKDKLLAKLHQLLIVPSDFRPGSYGQEIHEMTEMRALAMGQYGHNNQPCHHILYLFAVLGDAATTQSTVRSVLDRAYGRDFYAGDEDNGEQGAWFVLSALGLYSATPGSTDYILGSPIFRHVRIDRNSIVKYDNYYEISFEESQAIATAHRSGSNKKKEKDENKYLDIIAIGTRPDIVYVDRVTINGTVVSGSTINDALLQQDGVLRFQMRGESAMNADDEEAVNRDIQLIHNTPTELFTVSDLTKAGISSSSDSTTSDNIANNGNSMRVVRYARMVKELAAQASVMHSLKQEVTQLKKGRTVSFVR